MAMGRPWTAGTASAAVTLGLAVLLLLSQGRPVRQIEAIPTPPPPETRRPAGPAPVVLPPPPARAPASPEAARATRKALVPRTDHDRGTPPARIEPLKPRPVQAPNVEAAVPPVDMQPRRPLETPPSKEAAPDSTETLLPTRQNALEGRVLLRLMEAGKGPLVEIAWPASQNDRAVLYARLISCHGMRSALLAPDFGIFLNEGPPGKPLALDLDRFSGFVRHPAGAMSRAEKAKIDEIGRRHGASGKRPVRLFPRSVDAALLGGLSTSVGPDYLAARSIRAHYRLENLRVIVERIAIDRKPVPGRIVLPQIRGRSC